MFVAVWPFYEAACVIRVTVPAAAGLGQTTLGGAGGLTFGSLLATSTAPTVAAAPSVGLGGVDFSTSSENKSDASSGASAQ